MDEEVFFVQQSTWMLWIFVGFASDKNPLAGQPICRVVGRNNLQDFGEVLQGGRGYRGS